MSRIKDDASNQIFLCECPLTARSGH